MSRTMWKVAAAMSFLLLLAACDKCGNLNINLPKACTDAKPQG